MAWCGAWSSTTISPAATAAPHAAARLPASLNELAPTLSETRRNTTSISKAPDRPYRHPVATDTPRDMSQSSSPPTNDTSAATNTTYLRGGGVRRVA